MSDPVIQTVNLTKQFGSVLANDRISLTVNQGEIHCLLGENGAGKTTFAECLYGYYQPDGGEILYRGNRVTLASPRDAAQLGIGMVHQHFVLIRPFTVIENVLLRTRAPGSSFDLKRTEQELRSLCEQYGISLDLHAQIWQLSVGEQQWVEILTARFAGARLLILDEPTAVLTPQEVSRLFAVLQRLKAEGLSVIFITHKLQEVMAVGDRVTTLHRGRLVDTVETRSVTEAALARRMVGREVVLQVSQDYPPAGEPVLEIRNLRARGDRGEEALKGVTLNLHAREILGLAGVAGNGQKELFEVLAGVRRAEAGEVAFAGADITHLAPKQIRQLGIAHIPADRLSQGLVPEFTVAENLILGQQRAPRFRRGPLLDQERIVRSAKSLISAFGIVTPSPKHATRHLSGGNLQKVILARELSQNPRCLIASQPTRGLDVGVIEYVHRRLLDERDAGMALLLISEDLDEILSLSTRVAVIFKGQIMGIVEARQARREQIGMLMAGMSTGEHAIQA